MNPVLPAVNDTKIWEAWLGLYNTPAITVAIELGIFETLQEAQESAQSLAAKMDYSERGLLALLGLLKNIGLLDKHGGQYLLNELSRQYMLPDSPFYWGALFHRVSDSLPMHKLLLDNVRDDATELERPAEGWESGHIDEETARYITDFMHSHSVAPAVGIAQSIDFSSVKKFLDIGGGSGCFSIALARVYSDLQCTVMDLPTICDVAKEYIERGGVSDRVNTQAVDMFRMDWPQGYDAHFFANIFHDWSLDTCAELAKHSFNALESGGTIYLQEMLLDDDGDGPHTAVAFSLMMCLGTKGQQFTFAQLESILLGAGFSNISVQPSYGYYSLVSGTKA